MKDILESIKRGLFEDSGEPESHRDNTGAPTKPYVAPSRPFAEPSGGMSILPDTPKIDLRRGSALDEVKSHVYQEAGPLNAFLTTLKSLEAAIPDETLRLSAAASVCVAQGAVVTAILNDIDIAMKRLAGERDSIDGAQQAKYAAEVASREKKAAELTNLIAVRAKEIADLTASRDAALRDAGAIEAQIKAKAKDYAGALSQIAADLEALRSKLQAISTGAVKKI